GVARLSPTCISHPNRRSSRKLTWAPSAARPPSARKNSKRRLYLAAAGLLLAACLATAPADAGKKDDTLVWATDRDNPIADPFYLNTRELVVIGHHFWARLVAS